MRRGVERVKQREGLSKKYEMLVVNEVNEGKRKTVA